RAPGGREPPAETPSDPADGARPSDATCARRRSENRPARRRDRRATPCSGSPMSRFARSSNRRPKTIDRPLHIAPHSIDLAVVDIHQSAIEQTVVGIDVVESSSRGRIDDSQSADPRLVQQPSDLMKSNSDDEPRGFDLEELQPSLECNHLLQISRLDVRLSPPTPHRSIDHG